MCFTQSLIKPAHPNWGSSASFFSAIFAIFQSRSSGNYVVKHWGVVWTTGIWLRLMRPSCLPVRPLFCECKKNTTLWSSGNTQRELSSLQILLSAKVWIATGDLTQVDLRILNLEECDWIIWPWNVQSIEKIQATLPDKNLQPTWQHCGTCSNGSKFVSENKPP